MRQAVVLANGIIEDAATMRERLAALPDAIIVAADGGSKHAAALGLAPDLIIGDLDSLDPVQRTEFEAAGAQITQAPVHKDETDLELALVYAAEQDAERIVVLGALGGRLDMTFANILLLTHPALDGLRVELWHERQTAWVIEPPGGPVPGEPGDTLSLIPVGGDALGVTTVNMAYPLRDETLAFGPARGVSNMIEAADAHVTLRSGLLLAIHTEGRA